MTQGEFEELLGLERGKQTVSKIETGAVIHPSEKVLAALATLTGLSPESIGEKIGKTAKLALPGAGSEVPLLFGHCLWGVPVFLAAARGRLPEFRVASLRRESDDLEFAWIKPAERAGRDGSRSPAEAAKRNRDPSAKAGASGDSRLLPISAATVLEALEAGTAQVGVIPADIAAAHMLQLVRVGTVFDGTQGASLLTPGGSPLDKKIQTLTSGRGDSVTTRDLAVALGAVLADPNGDEPATTDAPSRNRKDDSRKRAAKSGATQFAIGFDHTTVAASLYRAVEQAGERNQSSKPFSEMRWHHGIESASGLAWDELADKCSLNNRGAKLLAWISWEPHATWMQDRSEARPGDQRRQLKNYNLIYSPDELGRPRHLGFDVVIPNARVRTEAFAVCIDRLMQRLWEVTASLSSPAGDTLDIPTVEQIARYFQLTDAGPDEQIPHEDREKTQALLFKHRYVTYWDIGGRQMLSSED